MLRSLMIPLAAVLLSLALPARADDTSLLPGKQITIKLAAGAIPDAEAIVEKLTLPGSQHQVQARKTKNGTSEELTLQLWGNSVADADVSRTLKDALPALASADIQVSALAPMPPRMSLDGKRNRKVIHKEIVEEPAGTDGR